MLVSKHIWVLLRYSKSLLHPKSILPKRILSVQVKKRNILSFILNSLAFADSLSLHKNNHIDKYSSWLGGLRGQARILQQKKCRGGCELRRYLVLIQRTCIDSSGTKAHLSCTNSSFLCMQKACHWTWTSCVLLLILMMIFFQMTGQSH